jgi:hypothetical protein
VVQVINLPFLLLKVMMVEMEQVEEVELVAVELAQ